jgi:hypothetical protein
LLRCQLPDRYSALSDFKSTYSVCVETILRGDFSGKIIVFCLYQVFSDYYEESPALYYLRIDGSLVFQLQLVLVLLKISGGQKLGQNVLALVSSWCYLHSEPGHFFVDLTLVKAPGNAWRRSGIQRTEDDVVSSAEFGHRRFCPWWGTTKTDVP